jgi:hypothetical protein
MKNIVSGHFMQYLDRSKDVSWASFPSHRSIFAPAGAKGCSHG